jgi:excisionase family DNA binding protein
MKVDAFNVVPDTDAIIDDMLSGVPTVLSVKRTAEVLGTSKRTIQRWISDDRIQVLRRGRYVRVPRVEVERLARLLLDA